MADLSKIHQNKAPVRRHYLAEWLEVRQMTPVELLDVLNEAERWENFKPIDKSQVYRWLKGQLPQSAQQERIARALEMENPADLLRDPLDDWFAKFFRDRNREEIEKMKQMLEIAFPRKSA